MPYPEKSRSTYADFTLVGSNDVIAFAYNFGGFGLSDIRRTAEPVGTAIRVFDFFRLDNVLDPGHDF